MHTPPDQQLGFIDGYVDGYYYKPGEEEALKKRRSGLQAAVSEYYRTHRADKEMPVGQVLRKVVDPLEVSSSAVSASPGDAQRGGGFNGLVWLHYSEKERIGFVEGFLNALMPPTSQKVNFPKGPEYYVREISSLYGIDRSNPGRNKISDEILKRKIGQVLWALRNTGKRQKAVNQFRSEQP